MRLSKKLLISFYLLTLSLSGCGAFQVSDYKACVTLPYSGNGYCKRVLSRETVEIPAAEWKKTPRVEFTSEDYKLLRRDVLDNCAYDQCKQIRGALDAFFLRVDNSLQKIPVP